MKITNEMVNEFNQALETLDCVFRLSYNEEGYSNPSAEIAVVNRRFVQSYIINPTDEFYEILESFFKKKSIKLNYNNTRSIFWSKSGYSEEV